MWTRREHDFQSTESSQLNNRCVCNFEFENLHQKQNCLWCTFSEMCTVLISFRSLYRFDKCAELTRLYRVIDVISKFEVDMMKYFNKSRIDVLCQSNIQKNPNWFFKISKNNPYAPRLDKLRLNHFYNCISRIINSIFSIQSCLNCN